MEFERVPLPGWNWAVWSERQAAASSPSPRWRRRQQVDEPESAAVHGSWRPASEFETADGRSELDAAAAARRRRQRRRYERAKQQPSGPGPPGSAAAAGTVTAAVPCTDATVHVSWQRRRRWKFWLSATGIDERRPGPGQQPWRRRWDAEQQQQRRRRRQQQQRIQQYATKLCSSVGWRWDESSSISWIKLFANAVGW